MENKKINTHEENFPHSLELQNRKKLHITGVIEVISATATSIFVKTGGGNLSVNGSDLKIKNLNNAEKQVDIEGDVNEIKYTEKKKKFFAKVFK